MSEEETIKEKTEEKEEIEGVEPEETVSEEAEQSDDDSDENAEPVEPAPAPKKPVGDGEEDEYLALLKEDEKKKAEKDKAKEDAGETPPAEDEDGYISIMKDSKKPKKKEKKKDEETQQTEESSEPKIYALRTTANREDQVMSFVASNAARKKLGVFSVIRPHGMRGYIFLEAISRGDAEQAAFGVPYARGLLPSIIQYQEIEHMLEQVKKEANIQKNDIAEIISGPFKREKCKITRIDKAKEEVVVELLEAAVPIPLTLKIDAVKVIRRDGEASSED